MDSHYLLAIYDDDPLRGGIMFCASPADCDCVHTWGPSSGGKDFNPAARLMPPPEVIEHYRQVLIRQLARRTGEPSQAAEAADH